MADKATLRPTRAPASWQTRATARCRSSALDARAGGSVISVFIGRGRSMRADRKEGEGRDAEMSGTATMSDVGSTVNTLAAHGPVCDSSSTQDTGIRLERTINSARSSQAQATEAQRQARRSLRLGSQQCVRIAQERGEAPSHGGVMRGSILGRRCWRPSAKEGVGPRGGSNCSSSQAACRSLTSGGRC